MANPGEATASEARSLQALSNEELGALWVTVVKDYAKIRTGSSRDFWRKLLDEKEPGAVLAEFKRRALRRAADYEAYVDAVESWRP